MRLKISGQVWEVFSECTISSWLLTHLWSGHNYLTWMKSQRSPHGAISGTAGCLTTGIDSLELSLSRTTPVHHVAQANAVSEPALHLCQQDSHTQGSLHTARPCGMCEVMHRPGPMVTGCWNTLHWKTRTVNISADGPAINCVCSYLDKCTVLPASNILSSSPSLLRWSQTADCSRLVGRVKLSIKNNHELSTFFYYY